MKTIEGTVQISIKELDRLRSKDIDNDKFSEKIKEQIEELTGQMVQIQMFDNEYYGLTMFVNIYPESVKIKEISDKLVEAERVSDIWEKEARDIKWYQFWK